MKNDMIGLTLVFQIILWASVSAWGATGDIKSPDLGARYSTLKDNYGKTQTALAAKDLKPLSQFSSQYSGCYWIIENVNGVYLDDIFAVGIADYHLTTTVGTPGDPGTGPLFPPTPSTPSEKKTWRGPAVVFGSRYFVNDDVNLDGLGMTDFPTVEDSSDENALSISETTHIGNNGEAKETQYLRKQTDGGLAMKTVFKMAGRTATGYGYCWKPAAGHMP
jgi:hypothetical protein